MTLRIRELRELNTSRRFRHTASLFLAAVASCAQLHRPSISPRFCLAPGSGADHGPVSWNARGLGGPINSAPPPDTAAAALAGTWDVLTVATEGARPGAVDRWTLRLVPTTPAVRYDAPFGPRRSRNISVVAAGAPLRSSAGFDAIAAAQRRLAGRDRVEATYDSSTNRITLSFGPPMLDAGTFYAVTEVSDTLFAGRWTDGSYIVTEVQRGSVTTLEHMQGFFCARRVAHSQGRDQSLNER